MWWICAQNSRNPKYNILRCTLTIQLHHLRAENLRPLRSLRVLPCCLCCMIARMSKRLLWPKVSSEQGDMALGKKGNTWHPRENENKRTWDECRTGEYSWRERGPWKTEVVSWIDTRVGLKNHVINNKRANKQVHMMKASNNKNLFKSYCGFYTFI